MKIENDVDEEDDVYYGVYDKKNDGLLLLLYVVTVWRPNNKIRKIYRGCPKDLWSVANLCLVLF